ncbi:hypothetical protein VA7868_03016 [Vibrio aerogenes CECT 7868]|uniref:Uncharacterized protein n=1 Tax=Vibrio aerogenes CECT 7868 TaxID=1216006 RepID=A0A1M5ZQ31_9VIBR|nr:hypothetical protein VA7868_03016 [Vibrio aerogenes CECT 7868]
MLRGNRLIVIICNPPPDMMTGITDIDKFTTILLIVNLIARFEKVPVTTVSHRSFSQVCRRNQQGSLSQSVARCNDSGRETIRRKCFFKAMADLCVDGFCTINDVADISQIPRFCGIRPEHFHHMLKRVVRRTGNRCPAAVHLLQPQYRITGKYFGRNQGKA